MPDMTKMFAGLRGDAFVEQLRALALIASVQGASLRCSGCANKAEFIGMQRCGAPGGPVCNDCLELHRAWIDTAAIVAEANPYCRHCNEDVGRDHIYAVSLGDGTEVMM